MGAEEKKKQIFVFMDTNMVWNKTFDFNVFAITFLNQIITLRDFFEQEVKDSQIKIIFPNTVVRERFKQKYDILYEEIGKTLNTLIILKKNRKFNNDEAIEMLKYIQNQLHATIESEGKQFLHKYDIVVTPECPNEYFEKIVERAFKKETPFRNKNSDGFKDAILWYSIIDYLKKETLGNDDSIFFFTENTIDFESEFNYKEFNALINKDLHIIGFKSKPKQIFDSENREFLKYALKEAKDIEITEIEFTYSESADEVIVEKIYAKPFPSNLVSLINGVGKERKNCKKMLKEQVIKLLENFAFNVDSVKNNFKFVQLPSIERINIFLDHHDSDHYYEADHVNILFEDGDEGVVEPENVRIFEDSIHYFNSDGIIIFSINPTNHEEIVSFLEKLIDRKIDPGNVHYTVMD